MADKKREDLATATVDPLSPTPVAKAEQAVLARGTAVGRYLIVDRIGRGGMGEVYSAVDPELGRKVAIKLVAARAVEASSQSNGQVRLLREAQAMARLSHPSVVTIYDVGTYESGVFLAMELVEGTTLAEWLKAGQRTQAEILARFFEAGRGLVAAHQAGLVHRDFKPENVLVGADGRARVTDFGLARGLGPHIDIDLPDAPKDLLDEHLTAAGAAPGTLHFMSPEQIRGQEVDPRTDQFSFCVALYRALYQAPPFEGRAAELAGHVIRGEVSPAPPGSHVPGWLREILLKGLSVQPKDRYVSMEALLSALEKDPAVVRQRWLARGATALGVALLVAAAGWASRNQTKPCQGASARLLEVWNPRARAAIEKAFSDTKAAYAKDAARSVVEELDRRGAEWTKAHVDACEATRVRREQTEDVLALRMGCLDARLRELGALVDVFSAADEDTVKKAVPAVTSLEGAKGCADVATLSAPVRPPADPRKRAEVEALRANLAGPRASLLAGKFKPGLARATVLVGQADALGYPPVVAEAKELEGELMRDSGDPKGAEAVLLDAVAAADRAHHDEVRARALVALTMAVGVKQGHYEVGEEYGRLAMGALERVSAPDELAGTYWSAMGSMADAQGHYDEAVKRYERSLAARERASGADSFPVGFTLNNLGLTYFNQGQLPKAREALTRSLELERRGLGKDHPSLMNPMVNLGTVAVKEGKYDEGLKLQTEAYELAARSLGNAHPAVAIALGNLAETLLAMKRYPESIERSKQALEVFDRRFPEGHPSTVYVLVAEADSELELGRPADAEVALERALKTIAKDPLPPELRAKARWLMARALVARKEDPKRAKELIAQAQAELPKDAAQADLREKIDAVAATLIH